MSFSCAKNFFQRFWSDELHVESVAHGSFLSSDLLPSLGARINQATKLRRYIISPFNPRYRWWFTSWFIQIIYFSTMLLLLMSHSSFQGLGDVAGRSSRLLSLDLSIWVRISDIQKGCTSHHWQHCQWFLRHRYHSHVLRRISRQPIISSCWWSQENCNQVIRVLQPQSKFKQIN